MSAKGSACNTQIPLHHHSAGGITSSEMHFSVLLELEAVFRFMRQQVMRQEAAILFVPDRCSQK